MIGERASIFLYICSKNTSMTFEEAVSLVDRIKEQVIGIPVKGRLIESLFIGPTNWNEMHVFMNICLQKGKMKLSTSLLEKVSLCMVGL